MAIVQKLILGVNAQSFVFVKVISCFDKLRFFFFDCNIPRCTKEEEDCSTLVVGTNCGKSEFVQR